MVMTVSLLYLAYVAWNKDWKRHHKEVYQSLKVDSLKRVLMERCLSENTKEKIRYKKTIGDV
jgi:hypothetical protein